MVRCVRWLVERRAQALLVPVLALASPVVVGAADRSCASVKKSISLESQTASVSAGSNFFTGSSSLKKVAASMLTDAEQTMRRPPALCPVRCRSGAQGRIVFAARPTKFLDGYPGQAECRERLAVTAKRPLHFPGFSFSSADDFADQFSQFSRGNGTLGDDLYRQCPGVCSPQFSMVIRADQAAGSVDDIQVICGEARDKSDTVYQLTTAALWSCGK